MATSCFSAHVTHTDYIAPPTLNHGYAFLVNYHFLSFNWYAIGVNIALRVHAEVPVLKCY